MSSLQCARDCVYLSYPFLSVPVGCGLGNILGTFDLPAFTLPFNTVTSVLFLCLQPPAPAGTAVAAANVTDTAILWDQVNSRRGS